ncbi:MAG: hypothetical protein LW704_05770 [Cryomorphaceae bacterium]|nr:hypothetical protein [Cryomorphaceae bacterium]
MKHILTLFALLLVGELFAQAPPSMTYQAVVRDAAGSLINTGNVSIRTSILQGSSTGVTVQTETHAATTNTNGLASIQIGSINPLSVIDWSNGPYFLKTEIDPTGGTNYTISGVSQLLSVPYALYAASSGNGGGSGSANTLDQAYDQGGAGLGRSITADAGAVQINNGGSNTTALEVNSAVANSSAVLANVSGVGVGFRAERSQRTNSGNGNGCCWNLWFKPKNYRWLRCSWNWIQRYCWTIFFWCWVWTLRKQFRHVRFGYRHLWCWVQWCLWTNHQYCNGMVGLFHG